MSIVSRLALPLAVMSAIVAVAVPAADRRETRAVGGFNAISLAAPVKVDVTQGDSESLVVEGDEAALAELETVVEQSTLRIRTRLHKTVAGMSRVRVHIGARAIEALRVSGSGDIVTTSLRAPALKVAVSGSGDIRIGALEATTLEVSVAGSGDVSIGGRTDSIATSIAGSGDVKAGKLASRTARVSITGSGDVTVWAREALQVSVMGSGDVGYYGDPEVKRSVMGAGNIHRLGATPS